MIKFAALEILSAEYGDSRVIQRQAHRAEFTYSPREGYLYVRSRAISSRTNDNYDDFPADEIEKGYRSFIGKPVFVNHSNEDHKRARGVIIDAALHHDVNPNGMPDTWCEVLMEIDAVRFPKLAQAIVKGHIDRTSMGVDVEYSICSACGNRATSPAEYCRHIPQLKGSKIVRRNAKTGRPEETLIYESCFGLSFFENSLLVEDPADPTAVFTGVDDRGIRMAQKTAVRHTGGLGAFVAMEAGVFWHGSPSGDLRGSYNGLHVGTEEAARQALHARIGEPVEGSWDGTREYGKTLLKGRSKNLQSGYNMEDRPDHYPQPATYHLPVRKPGVGWRHGPAVAFEDREPGKHYNSVGAVYGDQSPVPMDAKPDIFPVRIKGPMTNTPQTPHEDFKANGLMAGQIKRGRARSGYYYRQVGEDPGSISAVVPGGDHLERIDRREAARRPQEGLAAFVAADAPDRSWIHEEHDYQGEGGNPRHITRTMTGMLPTHLVAHMPGVKGEVPGEHRNKQGQVWEDFKADIAANGIKRPIFITADSMQRPKISEGNHRRDAAVELGHKQVPVEMRYFGHAEWDNDLEARAQAHYDRENQLRSQGAADTVVLHRGVADIGPDQFVGAEHGVLKYQPYKSADDLLKDNHEEMGGFGQWWDHDPETAKFYANGGPRNGAVVSAAFPAHKVRPARGSTGHIVEEGTEGLVHAVHVNGDHGWERLPHTPGLKVTARYEPEPDAPEEGEFEKGPDPSGFYPGGIATRWRQAHQPLVQEALHQWKGDPINALTHWHHELNDDPQPDSGSGKKMRAGSGALRWELQNNSRTFGRKLYRGVNTPEDLVPEVGDVIDHDRRPRGYSSNQATARKFAGEPDRTPGRRPTVPVTYETSPGTKGLQIKDYGTGSGLDQTEQEYILHGQHQVTHVTPTEKGFHVRTQPVETRTEAMRTGMLRWVMATAYDSDEDLTTKGPGEIDQSLSDHYDKLGNHQAQQHRALTSMHYAVGDQQNYQGKRRVWGKSHEEVLNADPSSLRPWDVKNYESAKSEHHAAGQGIQEESSHIERHNDEYNRRGGWSRFFLVPDGHIHSSMACHSCRPTTQFSWLPHLSGKSEEEAVNQHGPFLCTHCFKSAPTEWKQNPAEVKAEEKKKSGDYCAGGKATKFPSRAELVQRKADHPQNKLVLEPGEAYYAGGRQGSQGKCPTCETIQKVKNSGDFYQHKPPATTMTPPREEPKGKPVLPPVTKAHKTHLRSKHGYDTDTFNSIDRDNGGSTDWGAYHDQIHANHSSGYWGHDHGEPPGHEAALLRLAYPPESLEPGLSGFVGSRPFSFGLQSTGTAGGRYYHVSPHWLPVGTKLTPGGGRRNFEGRADSDAVYMAGSEGDAERWGNAMAQDEPTGRLHIYEVQPHGEVTHSQGHVTDPEGFHDVVHQHAAPEATIVRHHYSYDPESGEAFYPKESKKAEISVAGLAVVARDTGRVLMLQRSNEDKKDPAAGTWEFAGGHLDEGESPAEGAIREWKEELGCPLPPGKFGKSWLSKRIYQGFVYVIDHEADVDINCDGDDRKVLNPDDPDGDSCEVAAWFDPKDLPDMPALRPEVKEGTDWSLFKPSAIEKVAAFDPFETEPIETHGIKVDPDPPKGMWGRGPQNSEDWDNEAEEKDVPIHTLLATQDFVHPSLLDKYRKGKKNRDPIKVAREDGRNYLIDGHHRVVIAKEKGEHSVPALFHSDDGGEPEDSDDFRHEAGLAAVLAAMVQDRLFDIKQYPTKKGPPQEPRRNKEFEQPDEGIIGKYLYHHSPPENRQSIMEHGLTPHDPQESSAKGSDIPPEDTPHGVYLGPYDSIGPHRTHHDIWAVDSNQVHLHHDPDDRENYWGFHYSEHPIPPEAMHLVHRAGEEHTAGLYSFIADVRGRPFHIDDVHASQRVKDKLKDRHGVDFEELRQSIKDNSHEFDWQHHSQHGLRLVGRVPTSRGHVIAVLHPDEEEDGQWWCKTAPKRPGRSQRQGVYNGDHERTPNQRGGGGRDLRGSPSCSCPTVRRGATGQDGEGRRGGGDRQGLAAFIAMEESGDPPVAHIPTAMERWQGETVHQPIAAAWKAMGAPMGAGAKDQYPERYEPNKGFGVHLKNGETETKSSTSPEGVASQYDVTPVPWADRDKHEIETGMPSMSYPDGVPRINAKVPGSERPLDHVYRIMHDDEYQQAKQRGYFKSDERMNLSDEGTVASEGSTGSFYAAPGPNRIVRLQHHPEDGWKRDSDNYIKTHQQIPFHRADLISPIIHNHQEIKGDPKRSHSVVDNFHIEGLEHEAPHLQHQASRPNIGKGWWLTPEGKKIGVYDHYETTPGMARSMIRPHMAESGQVRVRSYNHQLNVQTARPFTDQQRQSLLMDADKHSRVFVDVLHPETEESIHSESGGPEDAERMLTRAHHAAVPHTAGLAGFVAIEVQPESYHTLYRGLHFGEIEPHKIDEFHKDPQKYMRENQPKNVGIHWTDNADSAYNFATDRDPEGWAHESDPFGDDEEQGHIHGAILEARVHPRHIIDPESQEGKDYAMSDAILGHEHPENEVTVRGDARVHVHKIHAITEHPETGEHRWTTYDVSEHHLAGLEGFVAQNEGPSPYEADERDEEGFNPDGSCPYCGADKNHEWRNEHNDGHEMPYAKGNMLWRGFHIPTDSHPDLSSGDPEKMAKAVMERSNVGVHWSRDFHRAQKTFALPPRGHVGVLMGMNDWHCKDRAPVDPGYSHENEVRFKEGIPIKLHRLDLYPDRDQISHHDREKNWRNWQDLQRHVKGRPLTAAYESELSDEGRVSVAEQIMERHGHGGREWDIPRLHQDDPTRVERQKPVHDFVHGVLAANGHNPEMTPHVRVIPEHWDLRGGAQGSTDGMSYIGVHSHTNDLALLHECAHILTRKPEGPGGHGQDFRDMAQKLYHDHISPEAGRTFGELANPPQHTAMAWEEHGLGGMKAEQAGARSVRDAGFKGYVGQSNWDEDEGGDDTHHFDEDLYDKVTPEPTPEEEEHYQKHDDYPDSYMERHDQVYSDAVGKKQQEDEPDHTDDHLHHWIQEHSQDANEWRKHAKQPQQVDLTKGVYATQSHVGQFHIDRYLHGGEDEPSWHSQSGGQAHDYLGESHPLFVTHQGRLHAIEGHHRIAAALQRGDSHIEGWHHNLDKHPIAGYDKETGAGCEECEGHYDWDRDEQHLASLMVEADQPYAGGHTFEFKKANPREMGGSSLHELQAYHSTDTFESGKRMDSGSIRWHHKTGEIAGIDVRSQYRRQGLATELLNKAREIASTTRGVIAPKHSDQRTNEGEAWARSTGDRLPRRLQGLQAFAEDEDWRGLHQPSMGPPIHNLLEKDENGGQLAPNDIYTHMHYYTDGEDKWDSESHAAIRAARGDKPLHQRPAAPAKMFSERAGGGEMSPAQDAESDEAFARRKQRRADGEHHVTIYRAAPKGLKSIGPGDWVTPSASYARDHARHATDSKKDWPVYKARVPAKHVRWAGDSLNEWGYDGPEVKPTYHTRGGTQSERLSGLLEFAAL